MPRTKFEPTDGEAENRINRLDRSEMEVRGEGSFTVEKMKLEIGVKEMMTGESGVSMGVLRLKLFSLFLLFPFFSPSGVILWCYAM
ncbi:hypothetical protein A4A49_13992 [Nicotiana attenuata]|uniref:Uncharacterized protein n=1 Tax=Nicotiana attenuata TaxID=49451 RepID=A0A314L6N2_NICAT|nr:hypothetical protein A4A49_13992 [Nicotiana attenuata]